MTFQDENNILGKSVLDRIFFNNWHYSNDERNAFTTLELDIDYECNLACKYCYVDRYGDILYPKHLRDRGTILKNTRALIEWLIKNNMNPSLAIFSGELFSQKIGFEVMDLIYQLYKDTPSDIRPPDVVIPTNFTFLLSDKLTEMVDELKRKFDEINIKFVLSASIEGKYMKVNRPYKNSSVKDNRDDTYYDKVFKYCSKNRYGFHPMVYSNNIENWVKNFLWFQDMFKKYNIPPFALYLLEVRNQEWTSEQIVELQKFYDFLIKYLFDMAGRNKNTFIEYLYNHNSFNIISAPITTVGRGLSCSIQSSLYVRMGDLKIFPCHRLFYEQFQTAQFITDSYGHISGIEYINPELIVGTYSFQSNIAPYCESCINKYMCTKGCLGAQYETMGDMFTPIPTVCNLEFAKSIQFVKSMTEIGVLDLIKVNSSSSILENIVLIEELIYNKKEDI